MIKKTHLYQWHVSNSAQMAIFGGYEMPLWYYSAKNEHLSVLTNAGVFDTSHMCVVMVVLSHADFVVGLLKLDLGLIWEKR